MDYNNNKTINFLENMIDISVDDINYINDVSVIVIDTSNHKIGINILNPQYEIDVCYGIIKTSKLLSNDICTNNIYVNNNDDLKISNNTINLVENTSSKLYIENTDINFLITNSLEIINFDLDHFNINIHNKYDVNNLYINSNIINNYSIQIYLDNTIDAPRPIDISNKPNETIIIYPNTYIENNNNHSYGKFIYRSLKSIKLSDKINNNITLNTANYANIPLRLDSPVDTTSVEFSYSNFHSEFFESHNSIVNGDYGGILIKLDNIYDYMNDTNTASFVYYTNSINSSKYWTTFGDNLNLYDGSLSCTSINITNNNNIFTIDFSNIKTNDELNIISDTLKIESSNCNINIYNNLNIDASNVLIESSNITLSGELIKTIKKTLINNISFIGNIINSNDLDIVTNSITNIISERLNITSEITTISGNTTIDGSLNIKENDGSINRYAHVPIGTIVMYGYPTNIPNGWVLCDGTNNTPDLTNRFVKGANQSLDNLGDSSDNIEEIELTMDYFPDHSHNITYNNMSIIDNSHSHNFSVSISDNSDTHHHNLTSSSLEQWINGNHIHGITIVNDYKTNHDNHKHEIDTDHIHILENIDHNHEHFISHEGTSNHTHQINMKMLMDITSEHIDLPDNEIIKLQNRSEIYKIEDSTKKILQKKFVKTINDGTSNYYETINTRRVSDANALKFKKSTYVSTVNNFHDTKIDISLNAPNNDISSQHVNSFIRSDAAHNKTGNIVYSKYKQLLDTNENNAIDIYEITSSKIGSVNENNILNIDSINVKRFESIFTVIRKDISINDLYLNNWKSLQFPFSNYDSNFIMVNPYNQIGLPGPNNTTIFDQIATSSENSVIYNIGNTNPNEQLYSTIMLKWDKGYNYQEFDTYYNIVSYGGFNSDNCRQPLVSLKYNNNKTDISFVCVENNLTITSFTDILNGIGGYYLEIINKTNSNLYPNLGKIEYSNIGNITSYLKIKVNNLNTYWLDIENIEEYDTLNKSCKLKISDSLDPTSWDDLKSSITTIESVNLMNEENDNDFYFMQEYNGEPITKTNFYKLLEPISINDSNVREYYKKINDKIMHSRNINNGETGNILIENISKANEMGYTFNNIIKLFPNLYKNTIDWIINKDPIAYPTNDLWFKTEDLTVIDYVHNLCNEFSLDNKVYHKNFFMDICIYYFRTANNINIGTLDVNKWSELSNNNSPTNWVSYINYHFINKYVFSGDIDGASTDQNRKTIEYMRNTAPSIYEFLILKWMQYFAETQPEDDNGINLIDASINLGYTDNNVINSQNAVSDTINNIEYYLHSYIDDSVPDLSVSGSWSIKFNSFEDIVRMNNYPRDYSIADDKIMDMDVLEDSNIGTKYIGGYFVKSESSYYYNYLESYYYYYDLSFLRSYKGNVSQDYYLNNNVSPSFYVDSNSRIIFNKPVIINDLVYNTDLNNLNNYIISREDNYPYDYLQKVYAEILYDSYKKFKNVRVGEIKNYLNTGNIDVINEYSDNFSNNSNQNKIKYIEPELPKIINGDGKYFNLGENLDTSSNIIYIEVNNNIITNPSTHEKERFNSIAEYILPECKLLLYYDNDNDNDYSEIVDIIKVADRVYTTKDFLEANAILDDLYDNINKPEYIDSSLSRPEGCDNLYKLGFYISRTNDRKYFDKSSTSIKIYNTYKLSPINNIKVTNTNDSILNQEELKDKQERSYITVSDLSGGYYYNYNIDGDNEIIQHFNIEIFKNDRNWDYYNNEPKNIKIVDRKLDPKNIYYLKLTYLDFSFIPYNYRPLDLNKDLTGIEYMKIINFSNIDDHIFKFTVLRNTNMYFSDIKYFKYGGYNDADNQAYKNVSESDVNKSFYNTIVEKMYNRITYQGPNNLDARSYDLPRKKFKNDDYGDVIYDYSSMEIYFAFSNMALYDVHSTYPYEHSVFKGVTYSNNSNPTNMPKYSSNFFDTVFTNIYYNKYYKPYPVTFSNYTDVSKQSLINMSLNFFNNIMYTTQVELRKNEYIYQDYSNRRDYFTDIASFSNYLDVNIIKDQVVWNHEYNVNNSSSPNLFLREDDASNNANIKKYTLQWIDWCKEKLRNADPSHNNTDPNKNIDFIYEYGQGERYYWLLRKFIKRRYGQAWQDGNMYASVFNIEKVGDNLMCKTTFNRDEDFYNKYTYTTDKLGNTTFDEPEKDNPWHDYFNGITVNTNKKEIDIVEWIRQFVFENDSIIGPFTYGISRVNLTPSHYRDLYDRMKDDPVSEWTLPAFDNIETENPGNIHYDTFICNENRWEIVNYILMVMLFADERRAKEGSVTIMSEGVSVDVSSYNFITHNTDLNSMGIENIITKPKLFLTLSLLSNMIDEISTHKKKVKRTVIDNDERKVSIQNKLELLVAVENEYDYNTLHNHGGYTDITELKTTINEPSNNVHYHTLDPDLLDDIIKKNTDFTHSHNLDKTDENYNNNNRHRHIISKAWIDDNSYLQNYISLDDDGYVDNDVSYHTHNLDISINIYNDNYYIINKSNDLSINIHPSYYTLVYIMKE